jgi:hypothetical protein
MVGANVIVVSLCPLRKHAATTSDQGALNQPLLGLNNGSHRPAEDGTARHVGYPLRQCGGQRGRPAKLFPGCHVSWSAPGVSMPTQQVASSIPSPDCMLGWHGRDVSFRPKDSTDELSCRALELLKM